MTRLILSASPTQVAYCSSAHRAQLTPPPEKQWRRQVRWDHMEVLHNGCCCCSQTQTGGKYNYYVACVEVIYKQNLASLSSQITGIKIIIIIIVSAPSCAHSLLSVIGKTEPTWHHQHRIFAWEIDVASRRLMKGKGGMYLTALKNSYHERSSNSFSTTSNIEYNY